MYEPINKFTIPKPSVTTLTFSSYSNNPVASIIPNFIQTISSLTSKFGLSKPGRSSPLGLYITA